MAIAFLTQGYKIRQLNQFVNTSIFCALSLYIKRGKQCHYLTASDLKHEIQGYVTKQNTYTLLNGS